jgi:hypothetical protein
MKIVLAIGTVLLLMRGLTFSIKKFRDTKKRAPLTSGDEIRYYEDRVRYVDAVVMKQHKSKVTIRTSDDNKLWIVSRADCILKPKITTKKLNESEQNKAVKKALESVKNLNKIKS